MAEERGRVMEGKLVMIPTTKPGPWVFAHNLKRLCDEKNISAQDLATTTGISPEVLETYFASHRIPGPDNLGLLCGAFKVKAHELWLSPGHMIEVMQSADDDHDLKRTVTILEHKTVIEWSDEDKAWLVTVPDLPGCKTDGDTFQEALEMAEEAVVHYLASLK